MKSVLEAELMKLLTIHDFHNPGGSDFLPQVFFSEKNSLQKFLNSLIRMLSGGTGSFVIFLSQKVCLDNESHYILINIILRLQDQEQVLIASLTATMSVC